MVALLEIVILAIVIISLIVIYKLFKMIKPLVINAVVGLIVLILASFFGFGVNVSLVVVLIVAFGGIPAAILVILLAHFGIIFDPAFILNNIMF